jgi:hypothetical protein
VFLDRSATLIFCFVLLLGISAAAQDSTTFTSWYGSYSVKIPKNAVWITTASLLDSETGGPSYTYGDTWYAGDLSLQSIAIRYEKAGKSITTEEAASNIGRAAASLKRLQISFDLKILADRAVVVNGIPGRELVFENYTGEIAYRLFQAGRNAILLRAAYPKKEKAAGIAYLSSLRLVSPELVEAQKIKEDTPPALPQTPPANRPKLVDPIKGAIARILSEEQPVNTNGSMGPRKRMREVEYDADGYATKWIAYDIDWHPPVVDVYGYLDGMRVRRTSSRDLDLTPGPPNAKRDERYSVREELIFDEKGQLKEASSIRNDGKLLWRDLYKYGATTVETIGYNSEKPFGTTITTLDAKGEAISYDIFSAEGVITYHGNYSKHTFDASGNWISRLVTNYSAKDGKLEPGSTSKFQYRTITYRQ